MNAVLEYLAAHEPGLTQWLVLATVIFSIGIAGLLTRRNAVGILMAAELMLNSAALVFVIFNRFSAPSVDGQIMAIFIIAVAAAEAVIGMAIFVALFRYRQTIDVTQIALLRD